MNAQQIIALFNSDAWRARHGDVVMIQAPSDSCLGVDLQGLIIGGNAARNNHRLVGEGKVFGELGSVHRVIEAVEGDVIDHEEHPTRRLAAGTIRVGVLVQWNPEGWSNVVD